MLSTRRFRLVTIAAAVLDLLLSGPLPAGAELVANPVLAQQLPPPGWIADHRDEWLRQRPVYRSNCQKPEVVKEIRLLNRIVGHDEYLLSLTNSTDPAAARQAQLARQDMATLRRDVTTIDRLVAQLQALPACPPETQPAAPEAKTASAPAAPDASPVPAQAAPPQTASEAPAKPAAADRLVIRFDDRAVALTPSGIGAFHAAVAAARSGKVVQLAIAGCETAADFSKDSLCTRRRQSLEHNLAQSGVKNPERLFVVPP